MRYDLAVVGHIVRDQISRGGRTHATTLGGPCIYSSLAARALDASVIVVSRVGRDFTRKELAWVARRGIATDKIRRSSSPTTCFRIGYHKSGRTMQVAQRCDPLSPIDLEGFPASLATHIGLVSDDFPEDLALRLAQRDSVLSLEAQGYTRNIDRSGIVSQRKWNNASLLKTLDVMKASEPELRAMGVHRINQRNLAKLGPRIILVTKAAKGTVLWSREDGFFQVPAYKTRIRDPTGAGDALVGGFLVSWIRTGELLWSCAVGSAIASFVVEDFGPANFGSPKRDKQTRRKNTRRNQESTNWKIKSGAAHLELSGLREFSQKMIERVGQNLLN